MVEQLQYVSEIRLYVNINDTSGFWHLPFSYEDGVESYWVNNYSKKNLPFALDTMLIGITGLFVYLYYIVGQTGF